MATFGDKVSEVVHSGQVGNRLFSHIEKTGGCRDGRLYWNEFVPFLTSIGWSQENAQMAWWQADINKDGYLPRSEFIKFCGFPSVKPHIEQIEAGLVSHGSSNTGPGMMGGTGLMGQQGGPGMMGQHGNTDINQARMMGGPAPGTNYGNQQPYYDQSHSQAGYGSNQPGFGSSNYGSSQPGFNQPGYNQSGYNQSGTNYQGSNVGHNSGPSSFGNPPAGYGQPGYQPRQQQQRKNHGFGCCGAY